MVSITYQNKNDVCGKLRHEIAFSGIFPKMGAIMSAIWRSLFSGPVQCKIVILGLSNAGKSTILYRMNLGMVVVTKPTIGSNVEEITHKNVKFQV